MLKRDHFTDENECRVMWQTKALMHTTERFFESLNFRSLYEKKDHPTAFPPYFQFYTFCQHLVSLTPFLQIPFTEDSMSMWQAILCKLFFLTSCIDNFSTRLRLIRCMHDQGKRFSRTIICKRHAEIKENRRPVRAKQLKECGRKCISYQRKQ